MPRILNFKGLESGGPGSRVLPKNLYLAVSALDFSEEVKSG